MTNGNEVIETLKVIGNAGIESQRKGKTVSNIVGK